VANEHGRKAILIDLDPESHKKFQEFESP